MASLKIGSEKVCDQGDKIARIYLVLKSYLPKPWRDSISRPITRRTEKIPVDHAAQGDSEMVPLDNCFLKKY
jgi:hypothetical protein